VGTLADALDLVRTRLLGGAAVWSCDICFRCRVFAAGEDVAISSPDASREEACWSSNVLLAFSRSDAGSRFLLLLLPEDGEDMVAAAARESL